MTCPIVITTEDGSHSLIHPTWNESYHSHHGAIQESFHVYINQGLCIKKHHSEKPILILEFGFGTGLNAWLAMEYAWLHKTVIHYTSVEAYPIDLALAAQLNYPHHRSFDFDGKWFQQLHQAAWNKAVEIHSFFILEKRKCKFQDVEMPTHYFDVVFYDAFSPSKQPELWEQKILKKTCDALSINGWWLTYCAQGKLKRTLNEIGLHVDVLPGPPGKREMVRGIKL